MTVETGVFGKHQSAHEQRRNIAQAMKSAMQRDIDRSCGRALIRAEHEITAQTRYRRGIWRGA